MSSRDHMDPLEQPCCEGRVLVVDDEANMRRVLSALVRREGFETVEAANGVAALEILNEEKVDAVLTDLKMPQMNGIELLAEVRRRRVGIPVILLTAHGTIGSAVEALKRGGLRLPDEALRARRDPPGGRQGRRNAQARGGRDSHRARRGSRSAAPRPQPRSACGQAGHRARRPDHGDRAHQWRERHRQGAGRAQPAPAQRPP